MTPQEYLVEMTFTPFASLPGPAELAAFTERMVLPTLEACERLVAAGHIAAGGPTVAAPGFIFIARAESPQALEDLIAPLPLWPRAQTRIVPLGRFETRAALVRRRASAFAPKTAGLPAAVPAAN